MTIFGVALLAICTLIGVFIGDLLGVALQVKANVGGVGIAMMLLIAARVWLTRHGGLPHGIKLGVDGGFEGGWMTEPYAKPYDEGGKFYGLNTMKQPAYTEVVKEAHEAVRV